MPKKIHSIRGMHDILPEQTPAWQLLEQYLYNLMEAYGYTEVRMPYVEQTELFARSIGDVTDIVEKEMYTFDDRNGDSLSLRPEGTASCVRAGIEHGFLHNQVRRLWYMGPMFRHERPQKGRYRQFNQIGVEVFGIQSPDIDAELIMMNARLWRMLGLRNLRLEINTLGTLEERAAYRGVLVDYFANYESVLDEDSRRRLRTNPLRLLDSKNPDMHEIVTQAPMLSESLGKVSRQHFEGLKHYLDTAGIPYTINQHLVRGLDYYCHTVYEWVTEDLGAQGTVCAGGRYDGLVERLGGRFTPSIGFAMGIERVLALLQSQGDWNPVQAPDVYIVYSSEEMALQAMIFAESIRDALPELSIMCHCGAGGLKNQFKHADRSGAEYVLIIGEAELQNGQLGLKSLRGGHSQETIPKDNVIKHLAELFNIN